MSKFDKQKELERAMVQTELCKAVKDSWKFGFLSDEWEKKMIGVRYSKKGLQS